MAQTMRVSLAGFNTLTNTDPNNFSLFVDQSVDYILIKQKASGSVSVSGTTNVAHGLGYVSFCLAFVETSSGVFRKLFSSPIDGSGYWFEINSTNLALRNTSGNAKTFKYYIFYDVIV